MFKHSIKKNHFNRVHIESFQASVLVSYPLKTLEDQSFYDPFISGVFRGYEIGPLV